MATSSYSPRRNWEKNQDEAQSFKRAWNLFVNSINSASTQNPSSVRVRDQLVLRCKSKKHHRTTVVAHGKWILSLALVFFLLKLRKQMKRVLFSKKLEGRVFDFWWWKKLRTVINQRIKLSPLKNLDQGLLMMIDRSYIGEDLEKKDRKNIQDILSFWFAHSPNDSQKKLWMVSSSSNRELVHQVDKTIDAKFKKLVVSMYESEEMRKRWMNRNNFGWEGKLALIIALDQFSRHIYRSNGILEGSVRNRICQKDIDEMSLEISQVFTTEHQPEIRAGNIPLHFYVFALMPFRHESTIESLNFVQSQIHTASIIKSELDSTLQRFRRATTRRLNTLQDQERSSTSKTNRSNKDIAHHTYSDEEILESFPFHADLKNAKDHIVYRTIQSFLHQQNNLQKQNENSVLSCDDYGVFPIIVSLSGGVDSMVIAAVLSHMASQCSKSFNVKVIAAHINYANRPEAFAEANYVQKFCEQNHIDFRCRVVSEVKRGVTARDEYETIARAARYDFYKSIIRSLGLNSKKDEHNVPVMLGHHRGDLRENVLSNSLKGCSPLELSGMTSVSRIESVVIWRPLLPLEKESIFEYAHTYGVPYFKDTTPHWSTRGKLRNMLLPLLKDIYGDGSMNNLSSLATESDAACELFKQRILQPFLHGVTNYGCMGISFHTKPWKSQPLFFWKFVLKDLLHSVGRGMFSDKSVQSFVEKIQSLEIKSTCNQGMWLQCRKDYAVYLQEDGKTYILHPESFPFQKKDKYQFCCTPIEVGKSYLFGRWNVNTESIPCNISDDAEKITKLLNERSIQNMDHFMKGSFHYYLLVPKPNVLCVEDRISVQCSSPLEIFLFSRFRRPNAWKGIDLKIQATLPLIGNSEWAQREMSSMSNLENCSLVKISYTCSDVYPEVK